MKNIEYKKKFQFGKVNANNNKIGKRLNLVEIEMRLSIKDDKAVFTASGNIWNTTHSDIIQGGQCIDSVYDEFRKELKDLSLYREIMDLWEKWHLNDMNAGCEHQRAKGWTNKDVGMACPKCGYKYGTTWLYRQIDKGDLRRIMALLDVDIMKQMAILRSLK